MDDAPRWAMALCMRSATVFECFIPADRFELAAAARTDPFQGGGQTRCRILPGTVIGDGAFTAQLAARDDMIGIAQHPVRAVIATFHHNTAAVITVARDSFVRRISFTALTPKQDCGCQSHHGYDAGQRAISTPREFDLNTPVACQCGGIITTIERGVDQQSRWQQDGSVQYLP